MSEHAIPDHGPDVDVPTTVAYRRSLRASQERRVRTARRRRRLFRGRGAVLVAAGLLAVGSAGALAHEKVARSAKSTSGGSSVRAAQAALGISADGVAGPQTRRAIKRFQRSKGLAVDGVVGPQTLKALGVAAGKAPASGQEGAEAPGGDLQQIAQCESGGDSSAVSRDGKYHGKYQFDQATWERMGGTGSPSDAPEAEQDQRAAALMEAQGPSAWPNCAGS